MKNKILIISILSLLLVSLSISCQSGPSYTYQQPEDIDDGLTIGSLDEVGIDIELIEKAVSDINRGKYKEVHSMIIFKDDKLVLEEYFWGHKYQWDAPGHHAELVAWDRDMMHVCQSVTKSIVGTCVGIAVDGGFIKSINQSIFEYLPEYQHLSTGGKEQITIEHHCTRISR